MLKNGQNSLKRLQTVQTVHTVHTAHTAHIGTHTVHTRYTHGTHTHGIRGIRGNTVTLCHCNTVNVHVMLCSRASCVLRRVVGIEVCAVTSLGGRGGRRRMIANPEGSDCTHLTRPGVSSRPPSVNTRRGPVSHFRATRKNSGEDSAFLISSSSSPHRTSTTVPGLCRRIHPKRSLQKSLRSRSCQGRWAHHLWEGWYIATGNTPHLARVHRV